MLLVYLRLLSGIKASVSGSHKKLQDFCKHLLTYTVENNVSRSLESNLNPTHMCYLPLHSSSSLNQLNEMQTEHSMFESVVKEISLVIFTKVS